MADKDIDEFSGTETTGHEWDGIKELNTPMPRWWINTFYICIIWAIGYMILYPAWPLISDYTRGYLGYSSRAEFSAEMVVVREGQQVYIDQIRDASIEEVAASPELREFAVAGGRSAFSVNCTPCHGAGAQGSPGYPNLNDDDWLWGGTLDEIHHTITVGIRGTHDDTRLSDMPAFLSDEILDKGQIRDMATYVRSLSDKTIAAPAGTTEIFQENCAACHGENAKGNQEFGAPNLTDGIWLYGSDPETLITTISYSRKGVMPTWAGRLDPATIKSLAVFVHTLGGGE
jgi:cytochrome c oxidase cbb3-type subunit 3